jgi:hypothetical protein
MKPTFLIFALSTIVAAPPLMASGSSQPAAFALNAPTRRALTEKAVSFQRGESYDAVIRLMGRPTAEREFHFSKPRQFAGRLVQYWLVHERSGDSLGSTDQYIFFRFDTHQRLMQTDIRVSLTK